MVTNVPETKVFGGKRYRLRTVPGSGYATEINATSLAKEWRASGRCARVVKHTIRTRTEKAYGRKPRVEWHVYVR